MPTLTKGKERQRGPSASQMPAREESPTSSYLEQKTKGVQLERAPALTMSKTITAARTATFPMVTDEGAAGESSYYEPPAWNPPGDTEYPGWGHPRNNPGGNPGGNLNPVPGRPPGGGGGGLPQGVPVAGHPLEGEGGPLNGHTPTIF
jgi:hypothetical protein